MRNFKFAEVDRVHLLEKVISDGNFGEGITVEKGGAIIRTTVGELLYNLIVFIPVTDGLKNDQWFKAAAGVDPVMEYYDELDTQGLMDSTQIPEVLAKWLYLANAWNVRIGCQPNLYEIYVLREQYPELVELMDKPYGNYLFPQEFQAELSERIDKLYAFFSKIPDSSWGDWMRASKLKKHQVAQMFLSIGCRPNPKDEIPPPIIPSYMDGLETQRQNLQVAEATRTVQQITYTNIRDSGRFELLLYGICNGITIAWAQQDCLSPPHTWVPTDLYLPSMVARSAGLQYYDLKTRKVGVLKKGDPPGRYILRTVASCKLRNVDMVCPTCIGRVLAKRHIAQGFALAAYAAIDIGNLYYQLRLSTKHSFDEMGLKAVLNDPDGLFWKIFRLDNGFLFPKEYGDDLTLVFSEKEWDEILIHNKVPLSREIVIREVEIWRNGQQVGSFSMDNAVMVLDWLDVAKYQQEMSAEYHVPLGEYRAKTDHPIYEVRSLTVSMDKKLIRVRNVVRYAKKVAPEKLIKQNTKSKKKGSADEPTVLITSAEEWLNEALACAHAAGLSGTPTTYWALLLRLMAKDPKNLNLLPDNILESRVLPMKDAIFRHGSETYTGIFRRPPIDHPDLFSKDIRDVTPGNYFKLLLGGKQEI